MKQYVCILVICAGALFLAAPAPADVINLNFASIATGVDEGPQDGVFESFITVPNLGLVNNNGWTSFRTAFEFSLSDLPAGSTINSAQLTIVMSNFEGTRAIEVHGYAGDGTVQLNDFALNGQVAAFSLGANTQTLIFDVTSFVADLAANGKAFAGFNVREEPANTSNFIVMELALNGVPALSINFSTEQIADIDIKPGSVPNAINRNSEGKIPVAILSSPAFNAPGEVDATSLTFGRTGSETSLAFCNGTPEDVNGDGLPDMVCHFNTQVTGLLLGDTQGVLKGKTLGGVQIKGTDSVRIVR